ncbi:hypothetical protein OG394_36950 [Kribbella sp. NBC_01245]|uniref:hypothetical protein n=1 Tax=Kribbella sp. NBC_01245 TaxID=2903578 RepID=UPI002E2E4BA8|nr:hypothetical protein [Kribbella sp. NBC_01245]
MNGVISRDRAVRTVLGWVGLVAVTYVLAVIVAPDDDPCSGGAGFGCDLQSFLVWVGVLVGVPLLTTSLVVSLLAVLLIYRPNRVAQKTRPVLVASGIFWTCIALGLYTAWEIAMRTGTFS